MATQTGKMTVGRFIKEQRLNLIVPSASLDGKTVLITGANTGVGLEAARHCVRLNAAHVIIAVRTLSKGEAAKEEILKSQPESKTTISLYSVDYSSFASVKAFADKIIAEIPKLDIAILNAGINTMDWKVTADGWEQVLQVNVLSTAYLSLLLVPKIRESYNNASTLLPALVIVTSDTHYWASFKQRRMAGEELGILKAMNNQKETGGSMDKYMISKLLEIYFVRELSKWVDRNYKGEVVITGVNPGLCHSELIRETGLVKLVGDTFKWIFARTAEEGSRNYLWAATAGREAHGQYVSSCEVQRAADTVTSEEGQKLGAKVYQEIGQVLGELDGRVKIFF
ncbi:hypothetical protein AOL_s00173g25 [Orbilia oligospora ATCC 24927]|uniref:Uncharacterized protein n=1 Tax=Arthrobotrys oligospora (strain ATCC 24927 / CBS 115.81 / DSM 1491) TaxID=756982 RepID=G1XNK7_ARTOA|nr:hypothetical protein AOL_s00173g25 [Orbilia oligospora ATCC 24927]EGX44924.1 hypothetical protein AOL_s00173g25 [Orbilia oligospora ATCC 24927]